ncbi:unnamed protein product [Discula destructiva]
MSTGAWGGGGDVNAAREFMSSVTGGCRGGRGGGRGGHDASRGSYLPTNNGNGRVPTLVTAPPDYYWPTNMLNNAANQRAVANQRAAANNAQVANADNVDVRPMVIDSLAQTARAVLTPAVWGATTQRGQPTRAPFNSTPTSGNLITTGTSNSTPRASRAVPIVAPESSHSARRSGALSSQGLQSSRHAGPVHASAPTGHIGSRKAAGHLDENGLLKGTVWGVDHGPQQDDNWILTYKCERLTIHCTIVAEAAFQAHDLEAQKALYNVVKACAEVLRTKNPMKDQKLFDEACKILDKAQNDAWAHWVKFYRPAPPTADADAAAKASATHQNQVKNPNVEMRDAPAITYQSYQAQPQPQPQPQTQASSAQGGFDPIGFPQPSPNDFKNTRSSGFGAISPQQSNDVVVHQSVQEQTVQQQTIHHQPTRDAQSETRHYLVGFGNASESDRASAQQVNPVRQTNPVKTQQATQVPAAQSSDISTVHMQFPNDLPKDFDDPHARAVLEDFFFHNKRRPGH